MGHGFSITQELRPIQIILPLEAFRIAVSVKFLKNATQRNQGSSLEEVGKSYSPCLADLVFLLHKHWMEIISTLMTATRLRSLVGAPAPPSVYESRFVLHL